MQNFLLTAAARTLSLKQIMRLSDNEAFETMRDLRWEDGRPVCPKCESQERHYFLTKYHRWQCRDCHHQFSVTSGTIFADHKLPLQDYLAAIAIFSNGAKGHSALQMSRDLNIQYKSAFVICHKLREAIINGTDTDPLEGEVELDGSYFGGYTKPSNVKEARADRRKAVNQTGERRCVMILRERGNAGEGASRTRAFVIRNENQLDVTPMAHESIDPGALVHADEHSAYDQLDAFLTVVRVNHKVQYSNYANGACINACESYFARMTRCYVGQHHHMAPKYLVQYACEMAFREDTRRESNGTIFTGILRRAMQSGHSPEWRRYWQGNHRTGDGMYQG